MAERRHGTPSPTPSPGSPEPEAAEPSCAARSEEDERFIAVERRAWVEGVAEAAEPDLLAREEPLEIRVNGSSIAVVMRTPGDDLDLVRGFLLSERIVARAEDIASLRHCTTVESPEAEDNVMLARLHPSVELDLAALRRNLYASSSCGVCGKASIEAAMAVGPLTSRPAGAALRVPATVLGRLPEALRARQDVFERTGGLHAAGLFSAAGELLCAREDVGRHNAVDKVFGWAAEAGEALEQRVLMVSGRVSFEIVQKAVALGLPMIAAVSAPTSLAVALAEDAGLSLVGFVRGPRLCVYAGGERVVGGA